MSEFSGPVDGVEELTAPTLDDIKSQLTRIFSAEGFSNSPRLKDLLSFLVEQKLRNNTEYLKEYSIGVEVFGRSSNFDPRTDTIVRRTAVRLRKHLETYYATAGKEDPILIELPKGHYIPRFSVRIAASTPAEPTLIRRPNLFPWLLIGLGLLAVLAVVSWLMWPAKTQSAIPLTRPYRPRRLLTNSTSEGQSLLRIGAGQQYLQLLTTPDGKKLYAFTPSSITVLGVDDLQIKGILRLPKQFQSSFMARDGRRVYVSSSEGGVMVVDTASDRVLSDVIPTGEQAFDVAVTPDNGKLFLAMGNAGLKRIDLKTYQTRVLSSLACPINLDIDRAGKRLYVAYQCGGPGGKRGHDVVEIYDIDSEQRIWTIKDIPMVGARPLFGPQDELVLLNMSDACSAPDYDHVGCAEVPSFGFHLWRPIDHQVISSNYFPRPQMLGASGAFFPSGTRVALSGTSLVIWDWAKRLVLESLAWAPPALP